MQIKTESTFIPTHQKLYQDILKLTLSIQDNYPNYQKWYKNTFLEGLKKGERGIITVCDKGKVLGVVLFKDTPAEKKLCTLFVHPDYRKKGIATQLVKAVVQELGEKPFVSVSEQNFPQINPLFQKMGFHLSARVKGVYFPEKMEYYFNDKKQESIQNGLIPVLIQRMRQLKK